MCDIIVYMIDPKKPYNRLTNLPRSEESLKTQKF